MASRRFGQTQHRHPAIGACIAELILAGAATTVDITPFRPSRFSEGALAREHNVI